VLMNKNPDYCFYIDELLKIHPEAKFLACIRDPRAVVLSHQEHKGFNDFSQYMGDSAAAVSYFWKWSNEAILAAQAKYPNKILLVPYEQMVTDKENLLHKICSFLDIEFDQAMLTHEQQQNTKNETPNNTANNINTEKVAAEWEQWKADNRNQAVFTNRLAAWKQKLSTRNQEICNTISAATALKLGYDTAPPSLLKQTWLLFSCLPQIALGYITTTLFIRHYFHLPFSWRLLLAKYLKVRK
nr:sulfotransferase [Chitinophagales bacterium]